MEICHDSKSESLVIQDLIQISDKKEPDVIIPLKYFALCYDKDEIVEFSLIRAIKNRLENEFCENLGKITKIEIVQDKTDLILQGYIR